MSKTSLYTWTQTEDLVSITFGVKRAVVGKPGACDLFTSRTYVKLHLKSPKLFAEFDLAKDIKTASGLNRVVASENDLVLHLEKAVKGESWEDLICRDKETALRRRKEANSEYETEQKVAEDQRRDVEFRLDRFAVSEQMRLEGIQRNAIEARKDKEREEAEARLYAPLLQYEKVTTGEIFSESVAIRPAFSQQIPFTPKPNPTTATRETQFKEPPVPKNLKELQGPAYDFHPVWIKAKADALFNSGDFGSAINAYTEVIKAEPGNVPALLNRSAAYLKLFRVTEALRDVGLAEVGKSENEKIRAIIQVRKAAICAWQGLYAEAVDGFKAAKAIAPMIDIEPDIHRVEIRRESNKIKSAGDAFYRGGRLSDAREKYLQALDLDPMNELVLANLSQIALKSNALEDVKTFCHAALPLTVLNSRLRVKVLVRLAKAYRTENLEEARKALEQALAVEPENPHLLRFAQEIQAEIMKEKYEIQKREADTALRAGNMTEALRLYKDILLTTRDREARSALYTNMCACHLLLKQYFDVVSTAERGLQLNPSSGVKLRLLSRRANAYSALGQVHSAMMDLRKALELDPGNEQLLGELEMLTQSVRKT